jgi:phthiocerol/phenolphthiocerol synthesis type-I polyketide synthase E
MNGSEIAVVGMSCCVPGAANVDEFWNNVKEGVESISFFTNEQLFSGGHLSENEISHPQYVRARGILDGADLFDAVCFGMSPREAELTDPQQRIFLQCAWNALEHAGCAPGGDWGDVGVFAAMGNSTYFQTNLAGVRQQLDSIAAYQTSLWNEKDFLATHVSYKLDLRGPSMNVQTGCSSSLVAVRLATLSLLSGECDIALAGGVKVFTPQYRGYLYEQGGILSPDGHCRPFDAQARGTVSSNGAGIVVLKRLEDAIEHRNCIHAVIKGSAINNDGGLKLGYTAPGLEGQVNVIRTAQAAAEVDPATISYVEAHGTGTELGDPVEVAALTEAFRAGTSRKNYCALGSVKSNIGHLDTAAGVIGFIKTCLMLKHQALTPSLHFTAPNPALDLENSPFYVNTKFQHWHSDQPRRAGVSSLGIGGTNVHVVLEEAEHMVHQESLGKPRLLILSARTSRAVEDASLNLSNYLECNKEIHLADVAHTLQTGRRPFEHRQAVVIEENGSLAQSKSKVIKGRSQNHKSAVFLFPGQGAQYVNMALGIYNAEPIFRNEVDSCCDFLKPHLNLDLREVLFPTSDLQEPSAHRLSETAITQPALFVVEYSLAQLLMNWGIKPKAMLGNSIGEYVAACLAGVFSRDDALRLIAVRGRLMQSTVRGRMLAVSVSESEAVSLLNSELSLAVVSGESLCVLAGSENAVQQLEKRLTQTGVECQLLYTSHAFHSYLMDPIREEFVHEVRKLHLSPPSVPFYSCVTGNLIEPESATDPEYWAVQLRATVRLANAIRELGSDDKSVFVEAGPGRTMSGLFQELGCPAVSTMRRPKEQKADATHLLEAVGRLWTEGITVNWKAMNAGEHLCLVPLPGYSFEGKRYWIDPPDRFGAAVSSTNSTRGGKPFEQLSSHPSSSIRSEALAEASMQQIFLQQLRLMREQLESLDIPN